jgi:hypothetical protein
MTGGAAKDVWGAGGGDVRVIVAAGQPLVLAVLASMSLPKWATVSALIAMMPPAPITAESIFALPQRR